MDYFFLYDNVKNRANIMAVAIFEKFDKGKVIKQFKEKAFMFPRMRQRLVTFMGEYHWETMPQKEFEAVVD